MKMWNNQTVLDYIIGNDVENIDILEEDSTFMAKVIQVTKDKNMYYNCSKKIKSDIFFVRNMISYFEGDTDFIKDVVDFALEYENSKENIFELSIRACNALKDKNQDEVMKYEMLAASLYNVSMVNIEREKKADYMTEDLLNEVGMGFTVFEDIYNSNNVILNYVASRMINEIIGIYNFEEIFHKRYSSVDKIENVSKNKLITDYIALADKYLSEYVIMHPELLNNIYEYIDSIKRDWKYYDKRKSQERIDMLDDILDKIYYYKLDNAICYDIDFIIEKLIKKYKFSDEYEFINKRDDEYGQEMNENYIMNLDDEEYDKLIAEKKEANFDIEFMDMNVDHTFDNHRHYKNLDKIFKKVVNGECDYVEEPKTKCKIVKFPKRN